MRIKSNLGSSGYDDSAPVVRMRNADPTLNAEIKISG
jgi:hypothetical protein